MTSSLPWQYRHDSLVSLAGQDLTLNIKLYSIVKGVFCRYSNRPKIMALVGVLFDRDTCLADTFFKYDFSLLC